MKKVKARRQPTMKEVADWLKGEMEKALLAQSKKDASIQK